MVPKNITFEQGPIRPPNESQSLLIRVTRNCPWNLCMFCPVYKGQKFSLRSVDEIKKDIQGAKDVAEHIRSVSIQLGYDGEINNKVISYVLNNARHIESYVSVATWLYYKTYAVFLQDADNLIIKTNDLVEILQFLREKFPEINRITTYARSKTVYRKSLESLKRLKKAGLNRIHIGLETGYGPLLKLMKKGVTATQQIEAGIKVLDSGMELSEYVMPGLGGQEMGEAHAIETAKVLNQINPHFIRLRSLRIPGRIPLYEKVKDGTFSMQTDDMLAEEIEVFIETLEGITSTVTSDHIMNLLEEVSGKLPEDKEKMLSIVKKYQILSPLDRMIFQMGRRGGTYRSTDDLENDSETYGKIKNLIQEVKTKDGIRGVEEMIISMADRYI